VKTTISTYSSDENINNDSEHFVKESDYCEYSTEESVEFHTGMSFHREMEVDAENATFNKRLLTSRARERPTMRLRKKEKNGFAWTIRVSQQRSGTFELRRLRASLNDGSCLRRRDAASVVGRRTKNWGVRNA